jgi:hypothetical protein
LLLLTSFVLHLVAAIFQQMHTTFTGFQLILAGRLRLSALDDDKKPNLIQYCTSCHSKLTQQERKSDEPPTVVFNPLDESGLKYLPIETLKLCRIIDSAG